MVRAFQTLQACAELSMAEEAARRISTQVSIAIPAPAMQQPNEAAVPSEGSWPGQTLEPAGPTLAKTMFRSWEQRDASSCAELVRTMPAVQVCWA